MFTIVKFVLFTFVNMEYATRIDSVLKDYQKIKEKHLQGRYVHLDNIQPLLKKHANHFNIEEIGKSVLGKPIFSINLGSGEKKVLAWSQMHGNESTTTKAIFDLLNLLSTARPEVKKILSSCKISILPMLNPDGAEAYTRVNANAIDLNRDAYKQQEPESKVLRRFFDEFQPDLCLNLHDQRTIFSAGNTTNPASLSFLTPAMDKTCEIFEERKMSMGLIGGIAKDLAGVLPNRIGRYDDAFNINCTGDMFQSLKTPTILFEAGHCHGDYMREETREYIFAALVSVFVQFLSEENPSLRFKDYFKIPENDKNFRDIIIRDIRLKGKKRDVSIQYKEVLNEKKLIFVPVVEKIAKKIQETGHREIDGVNKKLELIGGEELLENVIVNKIVLNNEIFNLKYE